MKDAQYFLVVRFSVEPQAEAQVLGWLDGGHMRIERFAGEVEASHGIA